ncbi:MAG: Hpt domain-containing protein, partial [Syntrophomonadaceae bacterium]|nr:Hpt domain-containing protein [Syntrophomonadaceae bacterium]
MQKELSDIFFAEAGDLLSEASGALLAAEAAGNPGEAVNLVFRAVHSIKGGAQTMNLRLLAEVAHVAEDLLDPVRQGVSDADSRLVSLMLEAFDLMEGQLSAYRNGSGLEHLAERQENFLRSAAEVKSMLKPGKAAGERVATRVEKPVRSGEGRLLYMYFKIDPSAPMPQVRRFLLMDRLHNSGNVLYSQPGRDALEVDIPDPEIVDLKVVLQTDLNDGALRQACDVGDIKE